MSVSIAVSKYDEVLTSILVNEKSILGFLSAIFNFLARRTDFYYIPQGPNENMGFPPGVAEELVLKILRKCDPNNPMAAHGAKQSDLNNDIMCSTVAQEVEVIAEGDQIEDSNEKTERHMDKIKETDDPTFASNELYKPPVIPTQLNCDTYNGADRDNYLWSQNIMELDVIVKLPADIKTSKDLKVTINSGDLSIVTKSGDTIIKDSFPYKIKAIDSFWSISEGRLLIHLEKVQERWWNKLLNKEDPIDLTKIDCSRPLDDLPEDHIAKVRELQWNQGQKLKGLPTSDEIRNIEILKKAWDATGSPFKGQKFDPSIFSQANISSFNK